MLPMNSTRVPVILRPTSGPKNLTVPLGTGVPRNVATPLLTHGRDAFAPEVAMLSMTNPGSFQPLARPACYPRLNDRNGRAALVRQS